jgi:ribosome-associated translation inhibitor RaiA
MKGIYITEEGKKEIEDKIAEIKKIIKTRPKKYVLNPKLKEHLCCLEQIRFSATILPVEKSWNHFYGIVDGVDTRAYYPNGVIITNQQP